ncbi:MAG: HDOD domain-containing protein [Planctomycetaceae bacterium]
MDWGALFENELGDPGEIPAITRVWTPRAPRSIAQLSTLTHEGNVSEIRLTELIERDPELTSHILKLVNSCSIGLKTRIRSVPRAVAILGARRCKMIVLSAMLQASLRLTQIDPQRQEAFLTECLERALFARFAAEQLGRNAESAYVGGLLQDLLLPYLQNTHVSEYGKRDAATVSLTEFERETFAWDHAAATAHVLRSWKLPDDVACGVLFSHRLDRILGDERLRASALLPQAAASLLPDAFRQEPRGMARLVELQGQIPEFNFLEVAVQVDEELESLPTTTSARQPLCDRLARLAVTHVEERRLDIVWTGQQIGNFVLEEELGQGAMGLVYAARHATLQRKAAIKLMKGSHLDPQALARFETEAQRTSSLSNPHTIEIYDYGTTQQGVLYYVMEYLQGMSLHDLVTEHGPQPERRVVHILRQACASLAEAHTLSLIHRDIKPDNIFLSIKGNWHDCVKVLDFGLVKSLRGSNDEPGSRNICGTPMYLAPEAILRPEQIDGRADLYALGLVAYFLLTGRHAFTGVTTREVLLAQVSLVPPSVGEVAAMPVDPELDRLIMHCLQKSPDDRPNGVAELAERLGRLARGNEWTLDEARQWWQARDARSAVSEIQELLESVPEGRTAIISNPAREQALVGMGNG